MNGFLSSYLCLHGVMDGVEASFFVTFDVWNKPDWLFRFKQILKTI